MKDYSLQIISQHAISSVCNVAYSNVHPRYQSKDVRAFCLSSFSSRVMKSSASVTESFQCMNNSESAET